MRIIRSVFRLAASIALAASPNLALPASRDAVTVQEAKGHPALKRRPDAFRAVYRESKYLPSLSEPLRSEGDFVYWRGKGLIWAMLSPFKMETVVTLRGVEQWIDGEKQPEPPHADRLFKPTAESVSAVFSGDFERLARYFSFAKEPAEDGWALILTPSSVMMAPYLKEIRLEGREHISRITVMQAADRYSVFTYDVPHIGIENVTSEERALLAP
jgi:hypothetical protein